MTREWHVAEVRSRLIERREIALLDVREEGAYAVAHPLFAASLPMSRLEIDVLDRLPRKDVQIVVYDDGDALAQRAVHRLQELGYADVGLLHGGLAAWRAAGAELFRDVNVPSKAFGELVEARRHTPSIAAEELHAKLRAGESLVVVDARRFEEFRTMSIPSATSVPGGELVLRVPELAPDRNTLVVVNCAGRTRSIIGTQSLLNAKIPNPVVALRNGTIGWSLAGFPLDRDASRTYAPLGAETIRQSAFAARAVADRVGVVRIDAALYRTWSRDPTRTLYRFDVRAPGEYADGHMRGFRSAPGGQLVQETDVFAPVQGARIVVTDDDGVRANMAASWLAQMGWDVGVLEESAKQEPLERGAWRPARPPTPAVSTITPQALARLFKDGPVIVLDLATSPEYERGHLPGAWFAPRDGWAADFLAQLAHRAIVLTSPDGAMAAFSAPDFQRCSGIQPVVLTGGTAAWVAAGLPIEQGASDASASARDVYKRPYEGGDNLREAMQAYLEWEFGLVAQLERDDTHHFRVL
jgi:rhodanese-related sulfurtransferase